MALKDFIKQKASVVVMHDVDTVVSAINQMIEKHAGAVLVSADGRRLDGIVTERDVMTRLALRGLDVNTTKLREIMTSDVVTLHEDAAMDEAVSLMVQHRIRHLPIVGSNKEIVGMISLRYLLHDRIRELVDELHKMEAYINDAPGG